MVVYLTLSAQYESFVLPFIVLLAVPMALLGALGAQWIRGLQNDVFCQVGLVMLVGLSSKNAILIVEFAEQLRQRGMPLVESAIQSAAIRLRPILMTSLAFILGVVPLVLATGAGENGRHSVGTTVFGGMIMSTFLNLFFIPVLYLIIEGWRERGKAPKKPSLMSPEQALFAQREIWSSRVKSAGKEGRAFCDAIIARLARFPIELSGHHVLLSTSSHLPRSISSLSPCAAS